jgi:hypothetical protein
MTTTSKFLLFIFPFSVLFYFIQYYCKICFWPDTTLYFKEVSIHLFMLVSTLLVYFLVNLVVKLAVDKAGFTFLGLGLLKMMAAIVFLLPLIQDGKSDKIPTVIYFFVTYFIYLFIETLFVARLLNKK